MPHIPTNTYTVPFDPLNNGPGEFASAKERFNHHGFVHKRGSQVIPYPEFTQVHTRSERCIVDADVFDDLYLADFIDANKRYGGAECHICMLLTSV